MTAHLLEAKAVLCDADGNLFPSEEPAFAASAGVTNAFLQWVGVDQRFTAEELRRATTGKNFRTTAVDLAVSHGVPVSASVAGTRAGARTADHPLVTEAVLQEWVDREQVAVSAHLGEVLRPDPDVLEPLARLGSRFSLAAVSSSATPRLLVCFVSTGIDALIEPQRWYSAEDSLAVPTSKPHPAIYLHACEQMGVDPSDAVAVEDSRPGVQSAVAAGIRTIGNLQFVPPAERAAREQQLLADGAVTVVGSWSQVESLLA